MKFTIIILLALLTVSTAQAQSSCEMEAIARETQTSVACVGQAFATGELAITGRKTGAIEICDSPGFIVVIEGRIPGCHGSPDVFVQDKVIWLEDQDCRTPR